MKRRFPIELPELSQLELAANASGDRTASLEVLLKQVASQSRNGDLLPFYSIRSVSNRFNVPAATVSRIYRRLSAERVLRMVWGSRTLLEPSSENGHCRSFGIPINVSRFRASISYREGVRVLQSELWNHHLDEHFLLYEGSQEQVVDQCIRDRRPRFDDIVWLLPELRFKPTVLRLRDLGFRVFCFTDRELHGMPECHVISSDYPIRAILRKEVLRI